MACISPVPWYDLYFALDADANGRLSMAELGDGLRALLLGQSPTADPANLAETARGLDLDGNGDVEWAEWVALAIFSTPDLLDCDEPLEIAFRWLDGASGDGVLDAKDLVRFLPGATRKQVAQAVRPMARSPRAACQGEGAGLTLVDMQFLMRVARAGDTSEPHGAGLALALSTSGAQRAEIDSWFDEAWPNGKVLKI